MTTLETHSTNLGQTAPYELSPFAQDVLKITALVTMTLDHIAATFLVGNALLAACLHMLGRLSFPLFCILIAYNLSRRNGQAKTYVLWLLGFGLIAQIPFAMLRGAALNTMFTLALGIMCHEALKRIEHGRWAMPLTVLTFALTFLLAGFCDYRFVGPFMIPVAVMAIRHNSSTAWLLFLGVAWMGNNFRLEAVGIFTLYSLLQLVPYFNGTRILRHKWMAYAYYPAHLWLLLILSR